MKRLARKILFFTITLLATTGCDKLPANGDLDGLWQLMEIDTGGTVTDTKSDRLYCSFQLHLFMLGSQQAGPRAYFGYFEHKGSTIRFHRFTFRSDYTEDSNEDRLMTDDDLSVIQPWGFTSTDCTFTVKELTGKRLVISQGETTITYRKL